MKLGSETGSLVNDIFSHCLYPAKVGDGATILGWTDRAPATIISVERMHESFSDYHVTIQEDISVRMDAGGSSDIQEYKYFPNKDGEIMTFLVTNTHRPVVIEFNKKRNRWVKRKGTGVIFGIRDKYYDFNF